MPNQVLIVATEPVARTSADVARSLACTPIVVASEDEALAMLDRQPFTLIAIAGSTAAQRLRDAAESKQPMARVLELPDENGDDGVVRRLMERYLDRRAPSRPHFTAEERYRFLSNILESFTTTLELREVLRRIVTITREHFGADRAWLLHPVNEQSEYAKVAFSVARAELPQELDKGPIPLAGSQALIQRAMASTRPVVVSEGDAELDAELAQRFHVRSQIVQILFEYIAAGAGAFCGLA